MFFFVDSNGRSVYLLVCLFVDQSILRQALCLFFFVRSFVCPSVDRSILSICLSVCLYALLYLLVCCSLTCLFVCPSAHPSARCVPRWSTYFRTVCLSIRLFFYLYIFCPSNVSFVCLSVCRSVDLSSICLLSICVTVCTSTCLWIDLPIICSSIRPSVCLFSVDLSVYLSICQFMFRLFVDLSILIICPPFVSTENSHEAFRTFWNSLMECVRTIVSSTVGAIKLLNWPSFLRYGRVGACAESVGSLANWTTASELVEHHGGS